MCFTPAISLTTAIIEFVIATVILISCRKSLVNKFMASLVYVLGLYQFTEFMLCTSINPALWAKLGFIAYTFLPAIGLYFTIRMLRKNSKEKYLKLLFLIPIIFSLIALFTLNFFVNIECGRFFVTFQHLMKTFSIWLPIIYSAYYFSFIAALEIFLYTMFLRERNKIKKNIALTLFIAAFVSVLPAFILVTVLPSLSIYFSSIYCEFAILLAIAAIIISKLDSKLKK